MLVSMCGRYTLTKPTEQVARAFEAEAAPALFDGPARYNIAPSQPVTVVRHKAASGGRAPAQDNGTPRQMLPMRWGLVPFWADDPSIGNRMINARAESAASKPAYRAAMRYRRCLIPADGFYEWQAAAGKGPKQPHLIRRRDGGLFAFAGLWEHWRDAAGDELESCCILTTQPNELLQPIHNRMPVILPADAYARWLDPDARDVSAMSNLLRPADARMLEARRVSPRVNSPKHDDPACVEPLDA